MIEWSLETAHSKFRFGHIINIYSTFPKSSKFTDPRAIKALEIVNYTVFK